MELVLPIYNVSPHFSLKFSDKKVCIMHCKIQYLKYCIYEA